MKIIFMTSNIVTNDQETRITRQFLVAEFQW